MNVMANSESSDTDWDEEFEQMDTSTLCLFCDENMTSPESMFNHCMSHHNFDIDSFLVKHVTNVIVYIKLVNYMRQWKPTPEKLEQLCTNVPWDRDEYMKPYIQNDSLLMFDIEDYIGNVQCNNKFEEIKMALTHREYTELVTKLSTLEQQLHDAMRDMNKMREAAKTLVLRETAETSSQRKHEYDITEDDDSYFSCYAHYGIHQQMLQDSSRTETYRNAIISNRNIFQDKIVLDVGCGTGILSMFCASAGAKEVFGVDQSEIIYQAYGIIRENDLEKVVHLKRGQIENLPLAVDKVDIIVSEWMGYFLLFEDMIKSLIFARDHYLSPGGHLFPNRCTISLVAVSDHEMYRKYVGYWDDVYGYKMTSMKFEVIREVVVDLVDSKHVCSKFITIKELNLLTCNLEDCDFVSTFQLERINDNPITAIVGYFDCFFDDRLTNAVQLSTSPMSKPTHWKQTVFLLPKSIDGKKGDIHKGKITCRRNRRHRRELEVTIVIDDINQNYVF